jgi:hypothetical protein
MGLGIGHHHLTIDTGVASTNEETTAERTEGRGGIDRRDLIKRAAVMGGLVWTAPVIQSLASPAFAQGGSPPPPPPPPPPDASCFKYMFNWCWANDVQVCVDSGAISSGFNQNGPPAPECTQSLGENASGQIQSNPTCCQQEDASGDTLQWHQVPDFPDACVTRTGATCACPAGPTGVVTFTVTCPDCYFGDVTVLHGSRTGLDSGNCGNFSLSTSNTGGSPFTRSWTITFPANRAPVWFKFWVGCGLSVCSPPTVPCTQSDCLPGPPPGEPVASRTLNI